MLPSRQSILGKNPQNSAWRTRLPRFGAYGSYNNILYRPQAFSPLAIPGTQAWYDVSDLSSMRNDAGGIPGDTDTIKLIGDKSGNSAVNAFVSGGAASNTATSPDVSTTGNQTFAFDVLFPDYTPAGDITLVSKLSGNDGFQILLLTTGVLRLRVGDGASVTNVDSTTGLTLTNLAMGQFAVIWEDGVGASFTQNGAALGTAVAAVKTLTNAAVAITLWTGTPGVAYSFTCGTYTFDPSGATKLAGTFVAPITGETWTINTTGDLGARISGARDLVQMTAANQPILTIAASGNYLTFDGSNDYMKAASFLLVQPETVYFAGSQVTWTNGDTIYDGNATGQRMVLSQSTSTPRVAQFAGSSVNENAGWVVGARAVVTAIFSGASSINRINGGAPVGPADAGAQGANGFMVGANIVPGSFSNITVSEVIIRNVLDNTATQDAFIAYAMRKWQIP